MAGLLRFYSLTATSLEKTAAAYLRKAVRGRVQLVGKTFD